MKAFNLQICKGKDGSRALITSQVTNFLGSSHAQRSIAWNWDLTFSKWGSLLTGGSF